MAATLLTSPPVPQSLPSAPRASFQVSGRQLYYGTAEPVVLSNREMLNVLMELVARDTQRTFLWPVPVEQLPKYDTVVPNPLDIISVTARVVNGCYERYADFESDVVDIFVNCCMYNQSSSPYFGSGSTMLNALAEVLAAAGVAPAQAVLRRAGKPMASSQRALQPMVQTIAEWVLGEVQSRDVHNSFGKATPIASHHQTTYEAIKKRIIRAEYPSVLSLHRDIDLMLAAVIAAPENTGAVGLAAIQLRAELPRIISRAMHRLATELDGSATLLMGLFSADGCKDNSTNEPSACIPVRSPWLAPGSPADLTADPGIQSLLSVVDALVDLDSQKNFSFPILNAEYYDAVSKPIDFFTIRFKLLSGLYLQQAAKGGDVSGVTKTEDEEEKPQTKRKRKESSGTKSDAASPSAAIDIDAVLNGVVADVELIVDNCIAFTGPTSQTSNEICSIRAKLPSILQQFGLQR